MNLSITLPQTFLRFNQLSDLKRFCFHIAAGSASLPIQLSAGFRLLGTDSGCGNRGAQQFRFNRVDAT